MNRFLSCAVALAELLARAAIADAQTTSDPFAFFRPSIVISAGDRRQLDRGEPLARALSAGDRQVGILAAVPVEIGGDRLVAWMRQIAELKKSAYVVAIRRFSDPPTLGDLAGLALDEDDLLAARVCRPRACDLKLTSEEIAGMRGAIAGAGSDWRPAAQEAFRHIVLRRVQAYLAEGHLALERYDDDERTVSLGERFSSVLRQSRFLAVRLPQFAEFLERYPRGPALDVESFVYWSKERLGGKPIVSATHVSMVRGAGEGQPDALVAGKEIFATHYLNASLSLTAIVGGRSGPRRYLVYYNRSDVDLPRGLFGGIARWFVERRLRAEASAVLTGLRRRLEGGEPPSR